MVPSRSLFLALGLPALVRGTQYKLIQEYSGSTFFNGWDFFSNVDNLTHGNANFVNAAQATALQLAFVNSAGNAIMKVDNTTVVPPNADRNTIRITTTDSFPVGSLWVADMVHVPFGCSVWPAFWSQAVASTWPAGGEIDTFEGVNNVLNAQMALHTEPGCTAVNAVQTSTLVNSTDCSVLANENLGCVVENPDPNSYGAAFAAIGGGVFATEFAETGISIWFFSRPNVPASLQSSGIANGIDTSTFGTPVANYPATGCNIGTFFQPQNLVFDITLCGDFAGNPDIFAQTCSGSCYNNFVTGPPSNYDNAYFEVRSVRVFGTSPDVGTPTVSNATTSRRSAGGVGLAGSSGKRHAIRGARVNWR